MIPRIPTRPLLGLAAGLFLGFASLVAPVTPSVHAAGSSAWTGEVALYRRGTFSTQRSWLWCTAADVQIARNIARRDTDHSASGQRRYFEWMRARNHYDLPLAAGVDPAGWTAGMRHFVDDRYRLVSSPTFDEALRSAVQRIRQTSLPVAIAVSHGGHGWLIVGFSATADPAATADFEVTSVSVVGPLWGLQSKGGYDMRPNTRLTPAQLRRFFTPWRYEPMPMVWDGRFVSIQPVPDEPSGAASPSPPVQSASSADPTIAPSAEPSVPTPASDPPVGPVAEVPDDAAPTTSTPGPAAVRSSPAVPSTEPLVLAVVVAVMVIVSAAATAAVLRVRRGR